MISTSVIGILIFAIANLCLLFGLSFVLWMAVDAAKGDKYWWIVFILGFPLVGGAVYYFVEKKHDYAKLPEAQ